MTNDFSTTRLTTQEQPTFDIVDGNCSSVLVLPQSQERQREREAYEPVVSLKNA